MDKYPPINEKDVCTDWIEDLFDNNDVVRGDTCFVGFIADIPAAISWTYGTYCFVVKVMSFPTDNEKVYWRLKELLDDFKENETEIGSYLSFVKGTIKINMVWINH